MRVDYSEMFKQWLIDHPEMTTCKVCKTVIRKSHTTLGMCPDCFTWNKKGG